MPVGKGIALLGVGGNANNGSNCGLAYVNANNAFSNANDNWGARHTWIENICDIPLP